MPTRVIRDGILTSERVNALSANAELFYRRLMSVTDDYGRYPARLDQLRAYCYPLKLDATKEASIKGYLAECVASGLIVLYTIAGKQYLEMQDFGQRLNGKSKYPERIPGDSPEFPGNNGLGVDGDGDVVEDGGGRGKSEEAVLEAYHRLLPKCQAISVLNDKRKKRIAVAVKLARQVCREQGWAYVPAEFWSAYFTECSADAWMRGEVPNPKSASWVQNLDVLLAEDRFAEIMDKAIAAMRGGA